ncbi:hypothetical protein [Streptomyces paradoxus]|uniref:hypothetical protein n=1 Tax=Streptomyces paradoxus TaxID=66375 RepID=UPI00381C7571
MRRHLARLLTVLAVLAAAFATPGMASGKAHAADDWNPPAHLNQPLNEAWNHVESTR